MNKFRLIFNSLILNYDKDYSLRKWICLILVIKLVFFIYFNTCFQLYPELIIKRGFLYVVGGDTFTYYPPLINLMNGDGYGNACRMPGLVIPFVPFYLITQNEDLTYNLVIVFQFILSSISVFVLGLIANKIFNNNHRVFLITILVYSFWYHIGDHTLMADSLSISSLIFATYFFMLSINENFVDKRHIFFSGFFFSWSIFLRVIAIVPFIALCFLIFYWLLIKQKYVIKLFTTLLLFTGCFIVSESCWVIRNKICSDRFVPFTVPECYGSYSYNWLELTKIPTAWGLETTPWVNEIDWWLDVNSTSKQFPANKNVFTKSYNADSLTNLKNTYWELRETQPLILNPSFERRVKLYLEEYRRENALKYYVLNPFKLFLKFHHKRRMEGMPFPALNKMNLFQKAYKATNWIFMLIISVLFLVAPLFLFYT